MPERNHSFSLVVSKEVIQKALRHALSLNEVGFLFFGVRNQISEIVRIPNTNCAKRNYFTWDKRQYNEAQILFSKKHYKLRIEGHSHSHPKHLRRPSEADLQYFKRALHIIVFPDDKCLRCWDFRAMDKNNKPYEIPIEIK